MSNLRLNGGESSQCLPYGHSSSLDLDAIAKRGDNGATNSVSLHLLSKANGIGGAWRECGACMEGIEILGTRQPPRCLAIFGKYSAVHGSSSASVTVDAIASAKLPYPVAIRVVGWPSSTPKGSSLRVTDAESGKILLNEGSESRRVPIVPGQRIRIVAEVSAAIDNDQSCCEKPSAAQVDLVVEAVPAGRMEYTDYVYESKLVRGIAESGYPAVALLALVDETAEFGLVPHCTATVIAPGTALTAAHCLAPPYADRPMVLFMGTQLHGLQVGARLIGEVVPVTGRDYPRDRANDLGFAYNSSTNADDVGLVYTEAGMLQQYTGKVAIPSDKVDVETLRRDQTVLRFVGYGSAEYDNLDRSGTKRRLDLPVVKVYSQTFESKTSIQAGSVCGGDSGGPAFLENSVPPLIVGIVSKGDIACQSIGVNTRADHYRLWISNHAK